MDGQTTATPQSPPLIEIPEGTGVKQIHSTVLGENILVYGLGNDDKLYCWSGKLHTWVLV